MKRMIIYGIVALSPIILIFLFAILWNIASKPNDYDQIEPQNFQYQTEEGDVFEITISGYTSRGPYYYAEIYCKDKRIISSGIPSLNKEDFHIDTVLNENGIICYSLFGAPFGKLSDGTWKDFTWTDFKDIQNAEIIYIGETLVQQDIQYFDWFARYLVYNESQIGIETAQRYQKEDFTENELQQIKEHDLSIQHIVVKAKIALDDLKRNE